MKRSLVTTRCGVPTWAFLVAAGLFFSSLGSSWPAVVAAADSLDDKLSQVSGAYAEAYISPLVHGTGANLNSGLYTNAHIGKSQLTFEIGLKFAGTYMSEDDKAFSRYQTVILDEDLGFNPGDPLYGEEAVLEFIGPTVLGDTDTDGEANVYVDGILVDSEPTISGVVDTRWVPLIIPEGSIGGIAGFKVTLRWLPSVSLGDLGKVKFFGFGLQYCVNNLIQTLPIDVVVGYFRQDLDIGKSLDTDASSFFLGLSRTSSVLTVYGGGALESSKMKVDYTWVSPNGNVPVSFETDGVQEGRLTIGAMVDVGLRIYAEANAGKLAVYSAGLMFGF